MQRLSAPERAREALRALMNGDLGTAAGRGDLVRLALRLIVEEALEGEVSDALGRERYERGEGGKAGCRRYHDVPYGGEAAIWEDGHGSGSIDERSRVDRNCAGSDRAEQNHLASRYPRPDLEQGVASTV